MRILVVEDDLEAQKYLVNGLKEAGHIVDDATEGETGLTLALSRPYDIAITCVLLIAKHWLGNQFVVHSNGADAQWSDARRICQKVLGYGDWFGIIEEAIMEETITKAGQDDERPDERHVTRRTLTEYQPPEMS